MSRVRVGVVRGGPSSEYEVSLKSGGAVLSSMPNHYDAKDIFIDKKGAWHLDGVEKEPERIIKQCDVIFNALHGEYGEDGKIQNVLEHYGIPFTGSTSFPSSLAMNKLLTKRVYVHHGLQTPEYSYIRKGHYEHFPEVVNDVIAEVPLPCIVKPAMAGSSVGIRIAKTRADFKESVEAAFEVSSLVLIEELIVGREATVGVIENFRGEKYYALPPVEIVKPENADFFDYEAKYGGETKELCPSSFSHSIKEELCSATIEAHKVLGLRHYSRSDFMVHPTKGIYILETNTLPGLTEQSLLPKAVKAVGSNLSEFIDHTIRLALGTVVN